MMSEDGNTKMRLTVLKLRYFQMMSEDGNRRFESPPPPPLIFSPPFPARANLKCPEDTFLTPLS
jgi:hypothetical protein